MNVEVHSDDVFGTSDLAALLTAATGTYTTPARIAAAIAKLIERGDLRDRRASGRRVVLTADLPVIESWFGCRFDVARGAGGLHHGR